ncbi:MULTISPECIES: cation-transporting P-type ATPase [Caballeronia]|uniref:cation-transporting P-type ATPase n=1 Tax=Caballeronia TaxID=1827195 RepID=UPI001F2BA13C|nr:MULTISPECIES: cation-transporting P-type ATPase [Caballeronia]
MSSLPETSADILEVRPPGGLTSDEAQRRLEVFGLNGTRDTTTPPWRRALEKCWAPVSVDAGSGDRAATDSRRIC